MIASLKQGWDALWGRGAFAVTVPSMDGALRPNSLLDEAPVVASLPGVDALAADGDVLYAAAGADLWAVEKSGAPRRVATFGGAVSALASAPDGRLAVALDTGEVFTLDPASPDARDAIAIDAGKGSVTAAAYGADGALYLCLGSSLHRASAWKRDLMLRGRSGAVFRVAPSARKAELIASGLAFPAGIAIGSDGAPVVSEAWSHRLVRVGAGRAPTEVLWDLPGYPGRMSTAAGGGYWLSIFAPRSQMIEFVLRERDYCEDMVARIPEDFWMAPALRSGRSFKEPLQGGGVRHLGIQKPWGPTRSYGLVVRLDAQFQPVSSFHSRADGTRHGITDVVSWGGGVAAASKGDGLLLSIDANEAAAA